MKTVLISSLAAGGLLLVSTAAGASDSRSIVGGNGHGPAIRADAQAYDWGDDGDVAFAAPDGSSYSYDGEWDGEFVDPQGRVFEGEWQGTVTRHDGTGRPMSSPDAGSQHHPHNGAPHLEADDVDYDHRPSRNYEGQEPRYDKHVRGRHSSRRYQHGYPQTYQHRWQGGYYYYPAPVVTVISGAPVTTTTVTEEIYYETERSAPRKRTIRKWKPKPKPRCVC